MLGKNIAYFSIPIHLRGALSAAEINTFYTLLDIFQVRHRNHPNKAVYAIPSQKYIAQRIGRSREWVCKCIAKLKRLGLITSQRRRRIHGVWQTNLYRLGHALWHLVNCANRSLSSILNHVKPTSQIVNTPCINKIKDKVKRNSLNEKGESLEQILTRLTDKLGLFSKRES